MPTLTISGTIAFPLGAEATPPSRTFSSQLIYTQRSIEDFVLPDDATDVSLLGTIADAKACYLEAVLGGGDLTVNAADNPLPISADGGFWVWFNPNGGLTALTITVTVVTRLRAYVFA